MYQNKVRRASVMMDLETRVHHLSYLSKCLDDVNKSQAEKGCLIEFLQLTKLIVSKNAKIQKIRTEFDRISKQHNPKRNVAGLTIDRNLMLQQDEYVRIVGHFSTFMSCEELIARIEKLPRSLIEETQRLIVCLSSYVQLFHGNGQNMTMHEYIDHLIQIDSNIPLLQYVDCSKMRSMLKTFSLHDLQKLRMLITTVLPRVGSVKKANLVTKTVISMYQHFRRLKGVLIDNIVDCFEKYQEICKELHTDRDSRYVLSNLPPNTMMLQLLTPDIIERFSTLGSYVQELDKQEKWKAICEAYCTLCMTIIPSVAVLASFRSMLYSRELTQFNPEWSLLDIPDKAALNKFIAKL